MPRSTSLAEPSTRRATKGKAATTSPTIMAVLPTVVPTIRRVRPFSRKTMMRKGTERRRFTMVPRTLLRTGLGRRPSLSVTARTRPSGRPMR